MPGAVSKAQSEGTLRHGFATNSEHLLDELRRLDLLIHLRLRERQGPQLSNPLAQFKGLVLLEEEIAELLPYAAAGVVDKDAAEQSNAQARMLLETLTGLEEEIQRRRETSLAEGINLFLPRLSRLFRLTRFEEECLLIGLAAEIDRKYEKLYAYLQDDVTRKRASVDLVLRLLCPTVEERLSARQAFDSQATLLKYLLLHLSDNATDSPSTFLSRSLQVDERIVNYLLGFEKLDARLERVARLIPLQEDAKLLAADEAIRSRMAEFITRHFNDATTANKSIWLHLCGPYGAGRHALAEAICHDLGLSLILCDASKMLEAEQPFEEAMRLLGRETVLQPAALCLENIDSLLADDDRQQFRLRSLVDALNDFPGLTFFLGSRSWKPLGLFKGTFIQLDFPTPDHKARKDYWEKHLSAGGRFAEGLDAVALASKFAFTPGQIQDALRAAETIARQRSPTEMVTMEDLSAACRAQCNLKLGALARKVEPHYTLGDIVLPPDQLKQLKEICRQAMHRQIVYGEWGFERKLSTGKGLNALFEGSPGTGKTMAAEVIARELQLDLYKIDLSQVVSKYIGETEKNLHQIFREAQSSGAILFFDEADALFGKRSEVKDAHDRYANIEISYLLQKMEEYDGIAILATNLRRNMDDAFVRRLRFIVEFPFPDEKYRERIWRVTFPREAPLAGDVDFARLSREIRLAGGSIKNIALAAAFYAASDGREIRMSHLAEAARREFQKMGLVWNEA